MSASLGSFPADATMAVEVIAPESPVVSVGIEQPGKVAFYSYNGGELQPGQFDVQTLYSGISAGTELTFYRGSNPYQHKQWDNALRSFVPDQAKDAHIPPQPFLGYMEVGRVAATRSDKAHVGDIVCMAYGHKTSHHANETEMFVRLPARADPALGIFVAQMGPICANTLAHADYFLNRSAQPNATLGSGLKGKRVAVFGAGVVGLITALLARQAGADVLVVDRLAGRLERAHSIGLQTLNSAECDIRHAVKHKLWASETGDPGSDVVIECTGSSLALNDAIAIARRQSYVFALGFYQGEAQGVMLGEEFHHNGIRLICVQIGNTMPGWGHKQLAQEVARQLQDREFAGGLARLITHHVPYSQAGRAFEALSGNKPELIQEFACDPTSGDIVQIVLYPDAVLANQTITAL